MATDDQLPRAIIARFFSGPPEKSTDVSVELLETMANALSGIIGENGFESLLSRAVRRVSKDFPWLHFDARSRLSDPEFEQFRRCFQAQSPTDTQAASILLFSTFVDILALLVGAHLTNIILENALGRAYASQLSKEQHNG